jgi:hypothetical protein
MAPPVVVPVGAGASALPARASRAPLAAAELAVDEPTSPGRPAAMRAAVEAASEVSAAVPSAAATLASADAPTSPQSAPRSAEALATEPQALEPPPSAEPPRGSPAAPRTQSVGPRRGRAFGPRIHTRLGGVFYLVNLALYLQLYGDGENLPLPLWDFVALIARALLTGDSRIADTLAGVGFADDPVWELLAELAGHAADESPGAGFVAPAAWRLPRAWLTPFTPGPVQHRIDRDRLTIWHAEGFAIIDVPAETDPAAQLAGELAAYVGAIGPAHAAPAAPSLEIAPVSPADPAQDWVARLVPYVRARLRRALGIEDDEIVARLLVHTARVHATATHVDVVLPLDALPIEVRFAGLDRDPGWVPAAGRFIAFHFE